MMKSRKLILLGLFSNSWEAMRMALNNSTRKMKLKYDEIQDLILTEAIEISDYTEILSLSSTLNIEIWGMRHDRSGLESDKD